MTFAGYASREEAGLKLARHLKSLAIKDPVVLALPRGGVPVAAQVARELAAPLDVLLVRKIGVPWQPELAAAAIVDGERPDLVVNDSVMHALGLTRADLEEEIVAEGKEIERRRKLYIGERQPVSVRNKSVIVIDDGVATGTTAKAALQALKRREPKSIIFAVPVGPPDTAEELRMHADQVVCLESPGSFYAIGQFYRDFHQLGDQEVIDALRSSGQETKA